MRPTDKTSAAIDLKAINYDEFKRLFREAALKRGSLRGVSEELGVTYSTVYRWDKSDPKLTEGIAMIRHTLVKR